MNVWRQELKPIQMSTIIKVNDSPKYFKLLGIDSKLILRSTACMSKFKASKAICCFITHRIYLTISYFIAFIFFIDKINTIF